MRCEKLVDLRDLVFNISLRCFAIWHNMYFFEQSVMKVTDMSTKNVVSFPFLGHRLGDDLVDWNSGVSVRPSVRPYVHKKFFRFPSNLVCG